LFNILQFVRGSRITEMTSSPAAASHVRADKPATRAYNPASIEGAGMAGGTGPAAHGMDKHGQELSGAIRAVHLMLSGMRLIRRPEPEDRIEPSLWPGVFARAPTATQ